MIGTIFRFFPERSKCANVISNPSPSERKAVNRLPKYDCFFLVIPHDQAKIKKENQYGAGKARLLGLGNSEGKLAAFSFLTFNENSTTILLHELLAKNQTQAGTFFVRCSARGIRRRFIKEDL